MTTGASDGDTCDASGAARGIETVGRRASTFLRQESRIRWARWFCVIGLVSGLALIVVIKPLDGLDEPSHIFRLDTIDSGWLRPPASAEAPDRYQLSGCLRTYVLAPAVRAEAFLDRFDNPPCAASMSPRTGLFQPIRASESYPPVSYLAAWPGYRFGRIIHGASGSVYGARLTQLLGYLVLVAMAIRATPWGKPFMFAVGLMPVSIQNASTVTADPMTAGLALLALALILRAIDRARRGIHMGRPEVVALGTTLLLLGLTKPAYSLLALMALAIPTGAFGSMRRRAASIAPVIAATALVSGAWYLCVIGGLDAPTRQGTDPVVQAQRVADHPAEFLKTIARTWTDPDELRSIVEGAFLPVSRIMLWPRLSLPLLAAAVVGLATTRLVDRPSERSTDDMSPNTMPIAADALDTASPSDRPHLPRFDLWAAALAGAVAVAVFLIVNYAMYTGTTPVGRPFVRGVQGRYFLPIAPLVLFGQLQPRGSVVPRWAVAWIPVAVIALTIWWTIGRAAVYSG